MVLAYSGFCVINEMLRLLFDMSSLKILESNLRFYLCFAFTSISYFSSILYNYIYILSYIFTSRRLTFINSVFIYNHFHIHISKLRLTFLFILIFLMIFRNTINAEEFFSPLNYSIPR